MVDWFPYLKLHLARKNNIEIIIENPENNKPDQVELISHDDPYDPFFSVYKSGDKYTVVLKLMN